MPEIGASQTFTFEISGVSSELSVAHFEAREAMSSLFEVELTLTSEDKDVSFASAVGKPACLTVTTDGAPPRYLNGIVSRLRHAEDGKTLSVYHATVVPKLWRLRHRQDARIFQEKTIPDILKAVLDGAGITDVKLALSAPYTPREYCVQYRESDFAFISRLMEEEGIFYFFEHTQSKHVMVLGDSKSVPDPIAAPATIAYRGTLGAMAFGESVARFASAEEVRPGKVTLTDFNFKKPSLSLLESTSAAFDADLEVYDYPGEYDDPGGGSAYAKVRLEEWQARRTTAEGESGVARLAPGYLFTLSDHTRDAENQQYLVTAVLHRGTQPQMRESGGGAGDAPSYRNTFEAAPATVPFRPERVTPRPTVKGAQTAIVTGPAGEEIYTDEHGRVKVHFHWDRTGTKDDKSSCWIRVSQLWAGAGWGAVWMPRIGHEVVVDFLEGDPDRPIIVGRVYHGTNVPPYPLPAERTKSTVKSDSSKGGGGFNELRFEDKKGSEEIFLHGQRDWTIDILHDKNQTIGNDETLFVGHDRKKKVDHDQSETIGNDKSISVGASHGETIATTQKISVGGDATYTVGAKLTESVASDKGVTVGGDLSEVVSGSVTLSVSGKKTESISETLTESVSKDVSSTIGGAHTQRVDKGMSVKVGEDLNVSVGSNQNVGVGKQYELTVGNGKVTVTSDGAILIEGTGITIKGSDTINLKSGSVKVESDGAVEVKAGGAVTIKGSSIAMN
jgi:type VI secretion system secreted protein VgrG